MFTGRKLAIATKHKKELVIAPLLEKELGVECFVPFDLDTDLLGTFTGEIEREQDPISTVRKKCEMAMQLAHCDLALASEGSFGAHPSIGFIPANEEYLIFIDRKEQLEITVKELSTETNFGGKEIKTLKELREFAKLSQFPSHALIMRGTKSDFKEIKKGISDWNSLEEYYRIFSEKSASVFVETDMRAMYNPTRMSVIANATNKLIEKIKNCCPNCHTPGFSIESAQAGLPCIDCHFPTRSVHSYTYKCKKCQHEQIILYPHNKKFEEPLYCDFCNP
jgi:hypothetical protein